MFDNLKRTVLKEKKYNWAYNKEPEKKAIEKQEKPIQKTVSKSSDCEVLHSCMMTNDYDNEEYYTMAKNPYVVLGLKKI